MPYIITEPETKSVTQTLLIDNARVDVTAVRTVDRVNIYQINTTMPLNRPAGISIDVAWSIGYQDGDVFIPVTQASAKIDAASAGALLFNTMAAPVTAGASHYSDHKGALYGILMAMNLIPAGTVV